MSRCSSTHIVDWIDIIVAQHTKASKLEMTDSNSSKSITGLDKVKFSYGLGMQKQ